MIDQEVRLHVYERFLADGSPPTYTETAVALGCPIEEAEASYRRLGDQHVLVFSPGTLDVWMANPLSAYPTPYWVETPRGSYWGNCIWDAFGIVAMLGGTGTISTTCQDCGEAMELRVEDGKLAPGEGVAHFAVPARRWWENIGFT
jgi:Alkylmercury lyase